jgi:hypothetical protein
VSTLNPTAPTQPVPDHDTLPGSGWRPTRARTLRDVRIPYVQWIVAAMCLATAVWVLAQSGRFGYYGDEWDFITHAREWTFADYFVAHNEHWSTIPMVIWAVLLSWFGTTGYLPFMVPLVIAHIGAATLLFLIVRRRAGDLVALAGAALVLIVAQGAENLVWAFQVGFVGSVTFGLLAIYLLDKVPTGDPADDLPVDDLDDQDDDDEDDEDEDEDDKPIFGRIGPPRQGVMPAVGASAALIASLACSGVGLFMVATVAVLLALDRPRWRQAWILVPPAVAYAIWYLADGASKAEVHRSPFSLDAAEQLVGYVPTGLGAGLAGTVSMTPYWGQIALALGTAALVLTLYRHRLQRALPIAAAVGLLLQFSLTGLVRAQFGDGQATASRYIYIVAFLAVLMLGEAAGDLPWRGWWRPAVVAAVALVSLHNVVTLERSFNAHADAMADLAGSLQTAWLLRDASDQEAELAPEPLQAPTLSARAYDQARMRLGSPYPEPTVESLSTLSPDGVNGAVRQLLPLKITVAKAGVSWIPCQQVGDANSTEPRRLTVTVRDGSFVTVAPSAATEVGLAQWVLGDGPDLALSKVPVRAGDALTVRLRLTGVNLIRHIGVEVPPGIAATVCVGNPA